MNVLDELWYGNTAPCERDSKAIIDKADEYERILT